VADSCHSLLHLRATVRDCRGPDSFSQRLWKVAASTDENDRIARLEAVVAVRIAVDFTGGGADGHELHHAANYSQARRTARQNQGDREHLESRCLDRTHLAVAHAKMVITTM
jgi:hypothetical protein